MIRDCFLGLVKVHILHHAAREPIHGLATIEELRRQARLPGTAARWEVGISMVDGRRGKEREMSESTVRVRYIVADVDAAIPFYTDMLGFKLELHPAPGFASLSKGNLQLLLNRPGAGGAGQAMSDGRAPAPGGWNRIQVEVEDLVATVERLKGAGGRFRNEIVVGNGGKQILLEDPSGNPVELFEPA